MSTEVRFTVPSLAEFWSCSQRHVIRLINSGQLEAINLSPNSRLRKLIITKEAVEEFEKAQRLSVDPRQPKKRLRQVNSFV